MSHSPAKPGRPMSPHLQVYRLPMTALMSISHRITGVILSGGCVLITAMLVAASVGEAQYDAIYNLTASPLGTVFFLAWAFALYYHLFNGVRHLIWDTVHMFELKHANMAGVLVILASVAATLATWYMAGH